MNNEQVEELKQIRQDLGVSKKDFLELSGLALNYKEFQDTKMSDDDVFELIKEGLLHIDSKHHSKDDPLRPKSVYDSFNIACEKFSFYPVYMGTTDEMDNDFPSLI